ncbi:MAG: vWA domain-containing protein [Promethearchaeota archaeon]|jgi:uncharacterized protein YegL
MNEKTTEIVFILDRSGSMSRIASDAIGGFNAFLKEQKDLPDKANFTLVLFDHEYNLVYNGVDIKEVEELDDKTYTPRGTTALLDAIGRTVDDVKARLDKSCPTCGCGEKNSSKVLVGILTDGLENASRDYSKTKINELIEAGKKNEWEFIFLAANQDAIKEGGGLGVSVYNNMNYTFDSQGIRKGMRAMKCASTSYRTLGHVGNFKQDADEEDKVEDLIDQVKTINAQKDDKKE